MAQLSFQIRTPGPVDADHAWDRNGWWIPSSYPAHAVRQAQQFLATRSRVGVLWFGPGGHLDEPVWIRVDVTEVHPRSTGSRDAPWLEVWDGQSTFGLFLSDVGLVERADPGADLTPVWPAAAPPGQTSARQVPPAEPAAAETAPGERPLPTLDELSLLTDRFLHLAGHRLGEGWKDVDAAAYATHQRLEKALEAEYSGFVATNIRVWINLFDTTHPCSSGPGEALPAYALTGTPYEVEINVHAHDPSCGCGQEYGYGDFADRIGQLLIVLSLYGGLIEAHPLLRMDTEDPGTLRDVTWEVDGPDGYGFREVRRRVIRDATDPGSPENVDTNPTYVPPYMAAEGWYLPEDGTSMLFSP